MEFILISDVNRIPIVNASDFGHSIAVVLLSVALICNFLMIHIESLYMIMGCLYHFFSEMSVDIFCP